MNVDEAFAPAIAFARALEGGELSCRVALDGEHRVDQEPDVEAALVELAEDRIDQEGHVVIVDFEHRDARRQRRRLEADFGRAALSLCQQRP